MTGYRFACKDLGMSCDFSIQGASSKDEALQIAAVHAKSTHKIATVPADLAAKLNAAIKG
jgi:predicted small metal-binding protein